MNGPISESRNMASDSIARHQLGVQVDTQMNVCLSAIKHCDRAVHKRHWPKLAKLADGVSEEMQSLKLLLLNLSMIDDQMAERLRYLDMQMRRLQRQLTLHINAVESDLLTLDHGLKKTDMIRSILQA